MVFQKLVQYLQQLAFGLNGVQDVPGTQVVDGGPALNQTRGQRPRRPDDAASGKAHGDITTDEVRTWKKPITQGVSLRTGQCGAEGLPDGRVACGPSTRGHQVQAGSAGMLLRRGDGRVEVVARDGPVVGPQRNLKITVAHKVYPRLGNA